MREPIFKVKPFKLKYPKECGKCGKIHLEATAGARMLDEGSIFDCVMFECDAPGCNSSCTILKHDLPENIVAI